MTTIQRKAFLIVTVLMMFLFVACCGLLVPTGARAAEEVNATGGGPSIVEGRDGAGVNAAAENDAVTAEQGRGQEEVGLMVQDGAGSVIASGEGWRITLQGTLVIFDKLPALTALTPWRRYESQIKAVDIQEGAAVEGSCWFMFTGCDIQSADLTKLDTSKVRSMLGLFQECTALTSVNLSGLDTSSLTSIDLSPLDFSSVTNMTYMLAGCTQLKSVNLADVNSAKAEYLTGMFYGCSSLEAST